MPIGTIMTSLFAINFDKTFDDGEGNTVTINLKKFKDGTVAGTLNSNTEEVLWQEDAKAIVRNVASLSKGNSYLIGRAFKLQLEIQNMIEEYA